MKQYLDAAVKAFHETDTQLAASLKQQPGGTAAAPGRVGRMPTARAGGRGRDPRGERASGGYAAPALVRNG